MSLPLYAATLFVSAFILFLVQPMIGKMILPKLGGTPQVWNTCMVFFQTVLLMGYFYTHLVSTRLKARQQILLHGLMLLIPLAILLPTPFDITAWEPTLGSNPIPSTLAVLFKYVALPFLVVSTTAPLLQKWFHFTGHPAAKDPYFLYGASNLGSLLALLAYPFAIEPFVSLENQRMVWAVGFVLLGIAVVSCAALVWKAAGKADDTPAPKPVAEPETAAIPAPAPVTPAVQATAITSDPKAGVKKQIGKGGMKGLAGKSAIATEPTGPKAVETVDGWRRFRWILLAAIPSSMMLGVTAHITTDLSPIPLFWLIPLTLYLLSFILVFARWPVVWVEGPHRFVLFAQPIAIALMIFGDVIGIGSTNLGTSIFLNILGFFATVMACHGELAKDRPSPKYLTDFYLCMSFGGMLGGMFNALFAPIMFKTLAEYSLAIFAAAIVRPKLGDFSMFDDWLSGVLGSNPAPVQHAKGGKHAVPSIQKPASEGNPLSPTLDYVFPFIVLIVAGVLAFTSVGMIFGPDSSVWFIYSVPLILACLMFSRPVRFGLAIGAILLIHHFHNLRSGEIRHQDRSFFGTITVTRSGNPVLVDGKTSYLLANSLTHGHINHGMNFEPLEGEAKKGGVDLSRLATTYYHRLGPVGLMMRKFDWFHQQQDKHDGANFSYSADARMPASLIGNALSSFGVNLPVHDLVTLWSEPPYATVGLGTGTMASYGRPYQHVHFYEIDNQIRRLSLPINDRDVTYFTYLKQAIDRGCELRLYMGDARLRMARDFRSFQDDVDKNFSYKPANAKDHLMYYLPKEGGGPEEFYHMMVVDAFSSDAIPAHLLTKQAFEMYFSRLAPDGVLCVHTSNRFVNLPRVVATLANDLDLNHLRGHDSSPFAKEDRKIGNVPNYTGHFTSEWVMVARKPTQKQIDDNNQLDPKDRKELDKLAHLKQFIPDGYDEAVNLRNKGRNVVRDPYWSSVAETGPRYLWTDDYYNVMAVIRRRGD